MKYQFAHTLVFLSKYCQEEFILRLMDGKIRYVSFHRGVDCPSVIVCYDDAEETHS